MKQRFILAPEAVRDLVEIWRYLKKESNENESVILDKIAYLAANPHIGHWPRDLTSADVRFFLVYSWLVVYRPETTPLQVISILHGRRDVASILEKRF